MALVPRPFAAVTPHADLKEVLPGIFCVNGSNYVPAPIPTRISRVMTVVRDGERLTLVNSVRLDDAGLAALDRLGKVTDVIKLAGNHGMDDAFYADRYKAKVWAIKGQRYTAGFGPRPDWYFEHHNDIDATTTLPIDGARVHVIGSKPPEGLLLLERHGGVLISGDCLQNWTSADAQCNFIGKVMLPILGFVRPHNIGPAWLKNCKPPLGDIRALLDLTFENVLPAHGKPVLGNAKELYRPIIVEKTGQG